LAGPSTVRKQRSQRAARASRAGVVPVLLLATTIVDFGPARTYWKETQSGSDEFTSDDLRVDQWKPIRAFVDDFNATRARHVMPGWMLGVDESVSSWRGRDGTVLGAMSHVTKINVALAWN
jgi:hypothetical protein